MFKLNYQLPKSYHLGNMGIGCFLEPPNHPRYFAQSIYTQYGNNPPYTQPQIMYKRNGYSDIEQVDKHFKPLPINNPRVIEWINYCFGYFRHCYTDPSKPDNVSDNTVIFPVSNFEKKVFIDDERFSDEWREKEKKAVAQANKDIFDYAKLIATPENHKATRFIRKYYPEFQPTSELINNPPKAFSWFERHETKPTPETCQGESWHKHPVNGQSCQVCGWNR